MDSVSVESSVVFKLSREYSNILRDGTSTSMVSKSQ